MSPRRCASTSPEQEEPSLGLRSADGADGVTVQAVINPDAPLDVEVGSTVKVTISYDLATDQLVVPTDAVVSRLDGTYAVQTLDDVGRPHVRRRRGRRRVGQSHRGDR